MLNKNNRPNITLTSLLLLVVLFAAQPAFAGVVLGEIVVGGRMLVASDGYVTAEYLGSDAGYFNTLFLHSPYPNYTRVFNKNTPTGKTKTLGWFDEGTELVFRLDVRNTGDSFFTGDAVRNFDGVAHAAAVTFLENNLYVTNVGFEDLEGGGDNDFNDFMFRLTNVIDPVPVPEPSVLTLFGAALLGLGLTRKKNRYRA